MYIRFYLSIILFSSITFSYSQSLCDSVYTNRANLGIYGATVNDMRFSDDGKRLYVGVEGSYSLFISDDTARSFYRAFPLDSLSYECGLKGWGGGLEKVITNQNGWILAQSTDISSGLNSSIISFNNGDTGTWQTAVEPIQLSNLTGDFENIIDIALGSNFAFITMGPYIVIRDTGGLDTNNIIDIRKHISGISTNIRVQNISVSSKNKYPFYIAVDTLKNPTGKERNLYKYDGSNFQLISIPDSLKGIRKALGADAGSTGDTLFIIGVDSFDNNFLYLTKNGGGSWDLIKTYNGVEDIKLYSSNFWKDSLGITSILFAPNGMYSSNLGDSWTTFIYAEDEQYIIHPLDTSFIVKANGFNIMSSFNGFNGQYDTLDNKGLESFTIYNIASNSDKSKFYLATSGGLAYTSAYQNNSIEPFDKWKPPYGIFPTNIKNNNATNLSVTTVAVNPFDSSNIVIGKESGFAYSLNGINGFTESTASGFINEADINAIAFVDSLTVIAVSGSIYSSGVGDIWQSTNKGQNWSKISVNGFSNGNCITVGYNATDTVLFVGSGNEVDSGFIWKSVNNGLNWTKINSVSTAAKPALPVKDIELYPGSLDSMLISAGGIGTGVLVSSFDGGNNYKQEIHYGSNLGKILNLKNNKIDTIYLLENLNTILEIKLSDSSIRTIYAGFPGEEIYDLASGSLLSGTSTGFYTIYIEPFDDIVSRVDGDIEVPLVLYPNPADKYIKINILDQGNFGNVIIYNSLGKEVLHKPLSGNNQIINTAFLKPGMYSINIGINNKIHSQKLMVIR